MTDATQGINAAVSNPRADFAALDTIEKRLFSLNYALGEISSLGEIIDPPQAFDERNEALGMLSQAHTELLCSEELTDILSRLEAHPELLDEFRQAQIAAIKRDRVQYMNIPAEKQAEFTKLTNEAGEVWRAAKKANEWDEFAGYLDRIVEALIEQAQAIDPDKKPYEVMLDLYEPGSSMSFYDPFFEEIKACVVPLLAECMQSNHKPSTACVQGTFDADRQWNMSADLMKLEGLNPDALWLGQTEHPFTGGPSQGFVIVSSHVYPDNLLSHVYALLHEGGHALYEQNVSPDLRYTSLSGGTSMGMHEAQSRFYENIIGHSEAFATPLYNLLRSHFPGHFSRVTPHQLYCAANYVEPGVSRLEADELTYPLHILVRYEIEQALFDRSITAKDVPALWADKYEEYLGVRPTGVSDGPLQDVHWSGGSLGYFPTYALGSAIGAQLKAHMIAEGIAFDEVLASGDLAPIHNWLKEHVWKWGRMRNTNEIMMASCGEPFKASYYCEYLRDKFSQLYRL